MSSTYVDMIGGEISAAGWTWGSVRYFDTETMREMYAVDAHKTGTPHRFTCRAETLQTALMEPRGVVSKTENEDDRGGTCSGADPGGRP